MVSAKAFNVAGMTSTLLLLVNAYGSLSYELPGTAVHHRSIVRAPGATFTSRSPRLRAATAGPAR